MKRTVNISLYSFFIGLMIAVGTHKITAQSLPGETSTHRQIFPRNQGYEGRMLTALGAWVQRMPADLVKALGPLSLKAAEMEYSTDGMITPEQVLAEVGSVNPRRRGIINGTLSGLIMIECGKKSSTVQDVALKNWATDLYRSLKVRSAKSVIDQYDRWKNNPCEYKAEGYSRPADCGLGALNQMGSYAGLTPPQDIIIKAGLNSVFGSGADKIAEGAALGAFALTMGVSAALVASSLGVTYTFVAGGVTTTISSSLFGAFTGAVAAGASCGSTAAGVGGLITTTSWAGVIAAPIAAVVMVIVIGTTEGIRVVENTKIEPMLKMKLAAAIEERINITNVFAEESGRSMFFMSFTEATTKGFQITESNVSGEARFYCQAGYLTKFRLSYSTNVDNTGYFPRYEKKEFTTKELNVGSEETFEIPADAKDIKVQAWYAYGINDWRPLINETIAKPTYRCYTSYGTIFGAKYKNDCPEVGNMTVTKPNQLTVTQGGAYQGWVYLSYKQNGKVVKVLDLKGVKMGFTTVFPIPKDATQIYLYIRTETGLVWEPWKKAFEKTWPVPPNECIKVYGTSLDPKWNNECK